MFQPDTVLGIVPYNEWGGEARGIVYASNISDAPNPDEPRWRLAVLVIIVLVISYATYRKMTAVKKILTQKHPHIW